MSERLRELAIALDNTWGVETLDLKGFSDHLQIVESTVHELAHASTFGLDPFEDSTKSLEGEVVHEFNKLGPSESDRMELEGLTVEFMVLDLLELKVGRQRKDQILDSALKNFKEKWWTKSIAWRVIRFLGGLPSTSYSARQVVAWVNRAAGREEIENGGNTEKASA